MDQLKDFVKRGQAAQVAVNRILAIPDRMKHLKVDPRGYPIPHGVVIDRDGVVHFAVNDERIRIKSITKNLCGICGTKLFRGRWLVGGPLASFHEHGAFIDPPMHSECAHYALAVCPYLAAPRYAREIGMLKAKAQKAAMREAGFTHLIDNTMMPGRPAGDLFIALMTTEKIMIDPETLNLKPKQPFNVVEYWRHGERIGNKDGWRIVLDALANFKEEDVA